MSKTFAIAALLLCGCFAAAAQNAPAAGQEPPAAAEPPPVADKGTTSQWVCIDETTKYTGAGKHMFYRIEMTNKCEQRLKCDVYAYLVSGKGPSHGHTRLIFGPKSSGAAATKVFEVKIKSMGGLGTTTRECRAF